MSANINGKQIKNGTTNLNKLDNTTPGQYTLFDTGIMIGLTDAPAQDTDISNKKYVDDSITSAVGTPFSGGLVSINATGTDTYIGTGTPVVTTYDINTLYVVTFQNNNTIPNPTLNSDGAGAITIVKTDDTGIIPLDVDDIVSSIQYFLTFNGTELQLYLTDPTPLPGTYTNLSPVPITLGGVNSGTVFNNNTITSVFNMLFYPYLVPNFTSFSISGVTTLLEVGASIPAGNKTFLWGTTNPGYVAPNTISILKLTGGTVVLGSNYANNGSHVINLASPVVFNVPGTYTWQVKGRRTNNSYFTRNFAVSWAYRTFRGTSTNPTITQSDALAMSSTITPTTAFATYNFAGGGYKYFVIPNNLPNPTLFRDQSTNLNIGMADATDGYTDTNAGLYTFKLLSITNTFGITQTYRVYRTKYTLGGAINIIVS